MSSNPSRFHPTRASWLQQALLVTPSLKPLLLCLGALCSPNSVPTPSTVPFNPSTCTGSSRVVVLRQILAFPPLPPGDLTYSCRGLYKPRIPGFISSSKFITKYQGHTWACRLATIPYRGGRHSGHAFRANCHWILSEDMVMRHRDWVWHRG